MNALQRQIERMGELQRRLLPRELPRLEGWSFAGYYRVGRWPGGDVYDFLQLPDNRTTLIVADASDQGATSTASVAVLHVLLHACPLSSGKDHAPFCPIQQPSYQPPHVLLQHLNRVLYEH